ncbi:MAG: S8 family serine peptidase, partial [Oscillospiraceae bacterium]|nr:S8 family serine peptidase [Oscillospiraceae bacterium]
MSAEEYEEYEVGGYIVRLNDRTVFDMRTAELFDDENMYHIENIRENMYSVDDKETLDELIRSGRVLRYEENSTAYLFDEPQEYNDPYFGSQWYWAPVKAGELRRITTGSNSVRVGIIDSGICAGHPDLEEVNIEEGYDFVGDKPGAEADFYHGLFVSGVICAKAGNGVGIAGISDGVTIIPLKCFEGKTTSTKYIIKALYAAVDEYNCDIVNLSFGIVNNNAEVREAVNYAESHNVIITAAVGNGGDNTVYYPAGYDNVIGVGAVGKAGNS